MSENPNGSELSNSAAMNREEFTRQAASFAESDVLGAPGQIQPVLEAAAIQPDERVLDIGCGTGFLLGEIAGHATQVVGIDVTPAMLLEARRRLEASGLHNVCLREASAETLPYGDDRFDLVLCRLVLHHCGDPGRVLREAYRVCRSGGRMVLCDITAHEDPAKADLHNRLERLRDGSHVAHYSATQLFRMMEAVGFTVTGQTRSWKTLRHFSEWTGLADVRPEVKPALKALLEAYSEGDAAGIQPARAENGEWTFYHHWLVVAGVK